ncbi:MAG TPA: hypothetical protein VL048_03855 [Xanthobacteraceae bacterium]|nr:hypothetical protein [Xanthobacteraceae bacterium]
MDDTPQQPTPIPAPPGFIEPHEGLLTAPPEGQLLYKVMAMENLLQSIAGSYLHFNRVDAYPDLDPNDGAVPPGDQAINAQATFEKAPDFSAADYYNRCRARTYACCFSLENTDYIWRTYGTGGTRGKICIVFDFAKLRARLNHTLTQGHCVLEHNGIRLHQIFSINYSVVEYVPWDAHRANTEYLQNPIKYTYLKSDKYRDDRELRIALSAIGIGHFVLNDGSRLDFPPSLQLGFDFKSAFADGTITRLLLAQDCDMDFLRTELDKLRIVPVEDGERSNHADQ